MLNRMAFVTGTLFCPHCHNIYSSVKHIDAFVENKRRRTDLDLIAVNCYRVLLLSTHFIDVVGVKNIDKVGGMGRLFDARGFEHERYRTALARSNPVVIRGSKRSSVGLCRVCGRILYWPIGERYVLRHTVPSESFFLSDGHIFCTPQFYDNHIKSAKLTRVGSQIIPIIDEPLDDLPEAVEELKAYLKSHRKFK